MVTVVLLFFVGCAAPRNPLLQGPKPRADYIVAARFDSQSRFPSNGEAEAHVLQRLQQIRSLGFNTIVLDYLPDEQRSDFLDAAAKLNLRAFLADRDVHYYLLTEKVRGADSLHELVAGRLGNLAVHPAFAGFAVLGGYPPQRVRNVVAALQQAGIGYLLPGQGEYGERGAVVAWLDANATPHIGGSLVEQLLLEFNAEIFAGWNDGVVIDFTPKGDSAGETNSEMMSAPNLDEESASLPVEGIKSQLYAVESLLMRANRWAQRLQGYERVPLAGPGLQMDPALQVAVFLREKRLYLFVVNQSSQPFRAPVRLPAVLAGRPVARAVEVPATSDRLAGNVFESRGGEITLNVTLRPGDAALFELF